MTGQPRVERLIGAAPDEHGDLLYDHRRFDTPQDEADERGYCTDTSHPL
jgi:hypothetical protein